LQYRYKTFNGRPGNIAQKHPVFDLYDRYVTKCVSVVFLYVPFEWRCCQVEALLPAA